MTQDEAKAVFDACRDAAVARNERGVLVLSIAEPYIEATAGRDTVLIDGYVSASEMEAIACWMRHPFELSRKGTEGGAP